MELFWNFITDFGDTAVTLPLAAATIVFLLFSGWRRAAIAFVLALIGAGIAIALVKLVLESCGHPLLHTDITNPSGHAAISATVYGCLAVLFGRNLPVGYRWYPGLAAGALMGAIALSRIILDAHSLPEVAVGLAIGGAATAMFFHVLATARAGAFRNLWLILVVALVMAVMHGSRWPIEDIVRSIVRLIRHSVPACA